MYGILTKITVDSSGFSKGLDDANKKLDGFAKSAKSGGGSIMDSFDGVLKSVLPISGGLVGLYGAMEAGKKVIESNKSLNDEWEQAIGSVDTAVKVLTTSIANMDFSNLLSNMQNAIKAGRDYVKAMDEISERTRAVGIIESGNEQEIAKQRIIMRDVNKSVQERAVAAQKVLNLMKQDADAALSLARDTKTTQFQNAVALTGNKLSEKQIENLLVIKETNRDLVKQAETLNENQQTLNDLEGQKANKMVPFTDDKQKQMDRLNKDVSSATPQVKQLASEFKVLNGTLNDANLDTLTNSWINANRAAASYDQKSLKIQTQQAKLNKGIIDLDEKAAKKDAKLDAKEAKLNSIEKITRDIKDLNDQLVNAVGDGNAIETLKLSRLINQKEELKAQLLLIQQISLIQASPVKKMKSKGINGITNDKASTYKGDIPEILQNQYDKNAFNTESYSADKAEKMNKELQKMSTYANLAGSAIDSLGSALITMAEGGEVSFKSLVLSTLDGVRQIINSLLVQAMAGQIAGNSKFGLPGLIMAGVGMIAVEALFASLPAFSKGGVVGGNQYSGDNIIARVNSNEEILTAQQSKLYHSQNNYSGDEVIFRIGVNELVGVIKQGNRKNKLIG